MNNELIFNKSEGEIIKNVGWSIGSYCNANCAHCYSREARKHGDLLTQEDIILVLDKLKKFGVNTINLGGNEPIFTHSMSAHDSLLPFMIREVKRRNITLGITTNGTTLLLLNELFHNEFDLVDDWDISLDSPFKEEHDNNRGKGFYNMAMKALELAKQKGLSCSVVYCLMNFNCSKEHAKALSEVTGHYNVDLRINTLKPTRIELKDLEADPNQISMFFQFLSQYYRVKHISDIASVIFSEEIINYCPCGKKSFSISPKKDNAIRITPCVYLQKYGVGNLLKDDIDTLLKKEIFQIFRQYEPHECPHCESIKECSGGCLAYMLLSSEQLNCDYRCPIYGKRIEKMKFKDTVLNNNSHVHENYLCTWIGENK